MYKSLLNRQEFLCKEIEKCRKIISSAPLGKLEIYKNHANTKWYFKPDNAEREYLPKSNVELASELAQKRIETERLNLLLKEKRAIEMFIKHAPNEDLLQEFAETQMLYSTVTAIGKKTKLSWQDTPFESNPAFTENLKHRSPSGHFLRSKSECLIDMQLFNRKIPFRYESPLLINGQIIYPDFTIYKESTNEFAYWEHCGMMDDPRYRRKAIEKEELYFSNGFFPGEKLFITYETSTNPITISAIDKVIDEIEEWLEL